MKLGNISLTTILRGVQEMMFGAMGRGDVSTGDKGAAEAYLIYAAWLVCNFAQLIVVVLGHCIACSLQVTSIAE
jgi:hypothetical protein